MDRPRFIAAALPPLFLAGTALAQPTAPAPAQPAAPPVPPAWEVNWGEQHCSMIRRPGPGRPYATAVAQVPGSDRPQILLIGENGARPPGGLTSVVLVPGDRAFDVTSAPEIRARRYVTALSGLPGDFRDALAGARELQLRVGGEIRATIPLANVRAAVAAHHRCTAEVLRLWGVDEAALEGLSQRPDSTNHSGLGPGDYPAAALRTATQGRVIARLTISPEGRATECVVVATSGNAVIDATTCRVILARGRYRPPLDAAGRPVSVRDIAAVTWLVPRTP